MSLSGRVIIAAAGSGKTQRLLEEALSDRSRRVLITTYTRENLREVEARLWEAGQGVEHRTTSMTWYEFLLRDGIKPYQAYKTDIGQIRSINFQTRRGQSNRQWVSKNNFNRYYLDSDNNVYHDAVSDLVCLLDEDSGGKVVARIAACYEFVCIDEVQDLAGYDLVLLERLLEAGIPVLAVGDPRQAVYSTHSGQRYRQYRRSNIVKWIENQERAGRVDCQTLTESYRCNQEICDFADALYPDLPKTCSKNMVEVHDGGVYLIDRDDLNAYRSIHSPQELRWNKKTVGCSCDALNFGQVKGASFDRVLIHATQPMTNYLENEAQLKDEARAKFYVAATRARDSVAIVPKTRIPNSRLSYWKPKS